MECEGIGFQNFVVEIITSLYMFCIPWVTPIFQTHYEIKNPPNLCKVCFSLGKMQGRRGMRQGEEKAWDNIQNSLATGLSICKKKKNVFPNWIAHKMLNEVSIRGCLKLTIIWWKESDFSGLKWAGMLKKPVAKYHIWRTAAAYFVVIFTKVPWQAASWCEDRDAASKTD